MDYKKYIKSDKWRERKRKFYESQHPYSYRCKLCSTRKNINVHHISYKNLGNEKDSDLAYLCTRCHKHLHLVEGLRGNTNKWLRKWKTKNKDWRNSVRGGLKNRITGRL